MELQAREDQNLDVAHGNGNILLLLKRNVLAAVVGAMLTLVAVGLFFGGYYLGVGAHRHALDEDEEREVRAAPLIKELPPIVWDGPCPRRALNCPASFQDNHPLILISLDGFHPDYLKGNAVPNIKRIARCGTSASYMYPAFPSKTFPNHYSQVTGLNPESHGIIDNSIYDPVEKKVFKIGTPESKKPYWWQRDPIWVTAGKQGKKTACFFWPGSDVKINDTYPTYFVKYDWKIPFESRVDKALEWLDLPVADRPGFITLYANQPDHNAHRYGVNGKEIDEALDKVDKMIARLFSGLQQRNLTGCVNIMIVSDHGMADTHCSRVIDVSSYINVSDVHSTMGPYGKIRPKGRKNTTAIENIIKQVSCKSSNMRAYAKEQLPVRLHFVNNDRIEPIFLDLDAGWTISSKGVKPGDSFCSGGSHGYDNLFPEMRAIFIAHGPSFKLNTTVRPFITTELYELMVELIDITGNPSNGTKGSLHHLLKSPRTLREQDELASPAIGVVPSDDIEYKFRVLAANCSCSQTSQQRDSEDFVEKNVLHLPFGIPFSKEDNSTMRLLYHEDYISAFDLKYRLPMWTSFTLQGLKNASKLDDVCWKGDARIHISDVPKCSDYNHPLALSQNIQQRPLYPPYFSSESKQDEATFVTNSVPKSLNHTKILEKKMYQVLGSWAAEEGQLNVVMGPAFDYSATGVKPSLGKIMSRKREFGHLVMPTHYFTIATWCLDKSKTLKTCDPTKLETTAFLLPNEPYTRNCEPGESVIKKNVARVVDIERLSGLSFFTGLPIYEAIRLRTFIPERVPS